MVLKHPIWRMSALGEDFIVCESQGREMGNVKVPVNFFEAAVLMTKVASFAVRAELLPIELPAVLGLILIILSLLLLVHVKLMILAELVKPMCKLTFRAVSASTVVAPILAELTFVHGSLNKTLLGLIEGGILGRTVDFLADYWNCWSLDNWRDHIHLTKRHKASRLLKVHCVERIQLRRRIVLQLRSNEVVGAGRESNVCVSFIGCCRSSIAQTVVSLAGLEATVVHLEATVYHFLRIQCKHSFLGYKISYLFVTLCLIESRWDGARMLRNWLVSHWLEFELLTLPRGRVKGGELLRIRGSEGRRRRLHCKVVLVIFKNKF